MATTPPRIPSPRRPRVSPATLPPLTHGVRWTVVPGRVPFQVRFVRDKDVANFTRAYDTATRTNVMKMLNLPGSTRVPSGPVLLELLAATDPRLAQSHGLSRVSVEIAETDTGFTFVLEVRRGRVCARVPASADPVPVPDNAAHARRVVRTAVRYAGLLLARGDDPSVAGALFALGASTR